MPTFNQDVLSSRRERNEAKDEFQEGNKENLQLHNQFIAVKFLEEIGNKPARCSVQINTTEVAHPVSFRFSMPSDMERFILSVMEAYKRITERKIPNDGFRYLKFQYFGDKIKEILTV